MHAALLQHIDDALNAALLHAELTPQLSDACRHALLGGGKRLRPLLVLASAQATGGPVESAFRAAAAIECVHAFSLVHDDLPALDNDLVRRGIPTVHAKYGEALAILAGDALLTIAFLSASSGSSPNPRVLSELSRATMRMINGQWFDAAARLDLVHHNKTGALIECACVLGGLSSNASASSLADLRSFGATLGLMFQIVDDVIDETQSTEHVGKATGKDREAGKLTYPVVHGLEDSRAAVARLHDDARGALNRLETASIPGASTVLLEAILKTCVSRTR